MAREALKAVPGIDSSRPGKKVLIRADSAGGTHAFLDWVHARGVQYCIGFVLPQDMAARYRRIPKKAWTPAVNDEGDPRQGADVADITDLLDLEGYPQRMRVIVRRKRPHPGAQLRLEDAGAYRLTAFATNTAHGQLAHLELWHRHRARCQDRIGNAKDTGLKNLPLKHYGANRIWVAIVQLATDLLAGHALLALAGHDAARWEPKRLRLGLFTTPATPARSARRTQPAHQTSAPWADLLTQAHTRLATVPTAPG